MLHGRVAQANSAPYPDLARRPHFPAGRAAFDFLFQGDLDDDRKN